MLLQKSKNGFKDADLKAKFLTFIVKIWKKQFELT